MRSRQSMQLVRTPPALPPSPPHTHTNLARQHALQDVGAVQAVDAVGAHHPLLLAHDTAGVVQEVGVAIHVGGDLSRRQRGGGGDGVNRDSQAKQSS